MDPTSHIPSVTLFHYLNGSMPLTDDERYHLDHCAYCQSVVAEYKKYIDPAMIPAAWNLGDREQLTHAVAGVCSRLEKRFSHNYQYQVSYTLSKQDNNAGSPDLVGIGVGGVVTDYYNPGLDIGPSNADRRHELVVSGVRQLPGQFVLGAVWNFRTSYPFSAKAGVDLNGDGANTDYVPGTTKNMGNRQTGAMLAAVNAYRATLGLSAISANQIDSSLFSRLDLRISKAFAFGETRRLELIGQVFNVLGRDNLGGPSTFYQTNVRSDAFGRIQAALPRQQGEVAVRFVF